MSERRSLRQEGSPRLWSLWLAALCIGVALSLLFVHGHASAEADLGPQALGTPAAPSPGDIRQEPIVEVEVDVRSQDDVALLASLGYACSVGVCKLELPDGEELALLERGLSVRVTARAIKVSGGAAALGEAYAFGQNLTDVPISDADWLGRFCRPRLVRHHDLRGPRRGHGHKGQVLRPRRARSR